jgi:hypothetical protein
MIEVSNSSSGIVDGGGTGLRVGSCNGKPILSLSVLALHRRQGSLPTSKKPRPDEE